MDDISAIKQRKIEQLRAHIEQSQQQHAEMQQVAQLEEAVKKYFTADALSRYGNLKAAHPELALQVLAFIGRAIQSGKVRMIDDEMLKELLRQMQPKEITIKRK
ncbi:MAG TPA: DNA-binding protein [Candidatus Nanoarchaeia archaeon]|nr:DNA-binding protein [Candidatus Nanoarchaeia archaeon]